LESDYAIEIMILNHYYKPSESPFLKYRLQVFDEINFVWLTMEVTLKLNSSVNFGRHEIRYICRLKYE